jgi:hypothetical protein
MRQRQSCPDTLDMCALFDFDRNNLRDLPSKRLYCDYACYLRSAVPFAGAGLDGLSKLGLQWADDFQRALLGGSDN